MKTSFPQLVEAVRQAKEKRGESKMKQSVELIINLKGIDLNKPENRFTEAVELPNSLGRKSRKLCVVASSSMAPAAKRITFISRVIEKEDVEALVGNKREAKKLAQSFDHVLVEPTLMGLAAKALGAALGSRGKSPVAIPPGQDLEKLAAKYSNTVIARLRKAPQINCIIGVEEDDDKELAENAEAILSRVIDRLEKRIRNVSAVYVKTTMGKPVAVSLS